MARYELKLPQMGESVEEATVSSWLKKVGDTIKVDDILVEVATDKVDSEIPSEVAGVITEILTPEKSVVKVGQLMAIIETQQQELQPVVIPVPTPTEQLPTTTIAVAAPPAEEAPAAIIPVEAAPTTEVAVAEEKIAQQVGLWVPYVPQLPLTLETETQEEVGERPFYSPLVKTIAKEENISMEELATIEGTGTDGRVTKHDILRYVEKRKAKEKDITTKLATQVTDLTLIDDKLGTSPFAIAVTIPVETPEPVSAAPTPEPVSVAPAPEPVSVVSTPEPVSAAPAALSPVELLLQQKEAAKKTAITEQTSAPVVEEAPAPIVEEAPAPIVEEAPAPVVEEAPTPIVEEAPAPVVEEAPTPIVEETPAPVVEEAPAPVVEETPAPIVEEAPAPVVEETPAPVVEETPAPLLEEAPAPISLEIPQDKPEEKPVVAATYTPSPVDDNVEVIEMTRMGKLIANYMIESKHVSAHATSFIEVDVTRIWNWRNKYKKAFEAREGEKLTFTPIFIEAVAKALRDFPLMNISTDGERIFKKKNINIGMATALPNGDLIVPVIKNADQLSLVGLAKNVNDLAKRARENKLKPDEIKGGTYTVTNIGAFGNLFGTPILNQPQVGILAIGAIQKVPAVVETPEGDVIAIRYKLMLSHSFDHRVVNGALGGMFVQRVAKYLEQWDINREI